MAGQQKSTILSTRYNECDRRSSCIASKIQIFSGAASRDRGPWQNCEGPGIDLSRPTPFDPPAAWLALAIMAASEDIYVSDISREISAKTGNVPNPLLAATPPRSTTPPPQAEKRKSDRKATGDSVRSDRPSVPSGVDSIDPSALSKALLKEFEDAGRHRDVTPGGSPSRKRQRVYGDR